MSRHARGRWERAGRWLGFVAGLGVVAVAWVYGPDAAQGLDTFRVRQVEVVGTRFLEPYSVVRAAGLGDGSSLFDDPGSWRAGVRTLALVEDVRVRRLFPSKVLLEVREVEPVALVAAETLRPVDAAGRLLELEPAGTLLDLPIVSGLTLEGEAEDEGAGRAVAEGASRSAIVTVAALAEHAEDVAGRLSQAELVGEELWLSFRDVRGMAVLSAAATSVELTQLRLTLADLVSRGELAQVRTIDVRFRDQVVVSFLNRPVIR